MPRKNFNHSSEISVQWKVHSSVERSQRQKTNGKTFDVYWLKELILWKCS